MSTNDLGPIMVPLDGSALSEHAIPLAASLARSRACPIHLVYVTELNLWPDELSDLTAISAIRRILHARQWGPDRLRTCKPAPLQMRGAGPFIAIRMQLVTRKSLGGLRTDLHSRVLDVHDQPIPGLYCVGEAAGFGGGGASGKRSLEGTFLPGCILTARAAAQSIAAG